MLYRKNLKYLVPYLVYSCTYIPIIVIHVLEVKIRESTKEKEVRDEDLVSGTLMSVDDIYCM